MPTIDDVATVAGVSKGTVSQVFTGSRPVSVETRKRILAAAEQLDWRPAMAAISFDATLLRGLADQYDNNRRPRMAAALRRGAQAIEAQVDAVTVR